MVGREGGYMVPSYADYFSGAGTDGCHYWVAWDGMGWDGIRLGGYRIDDAVNAKI